MSNPTAGQSSSISQHLREAKKLLQGSVPNAGYVWNVKICRVGGLILKFTGSRGPWMQLRLSESKKWADGLQLIRDVL